MRKLLRSAIATTIAFSMAAPAFAESRMDNDDDNNEVRAEVRVKAEAHMKKQASVADLACMQAAIEKRENALIAAVDTNVAAWKASLATRRDELVAAWKLTDTKARNDPVMEPWKHLHVARKSQQHDLRSSRRHT